MVEKLVAARMPKKDQKIDEHGEFSLPQIVSPPPILSH